jgi:hypothetical protein
MTLNKFKNKVQNMSEQDFKTFSNLMYRTFNFILAVEDMDIIEINKLQALPKEDNINTSSMELMNEFKRLFNLDIE